MTASYDLCRQIYDRFGWHDTTAYMYDTGTKIAVQFPANLNTEPGYWWYEGIDAVPLYDLDYLLGKLPEIRLEKWRDGHIVVKYYTANGIASKLERLGKVVKIEADTPVEAVAKLILALPEEVFEK